MSARINEKQNNKSLIVYCCAVCDKEQRGDTRLSRCGECKAVYYCGKVCQRVHWNLFSHKTKCKTIKQQVEGEKPLKNPYAEFLRNTHLVATKFEELALEQKLVQESFREIYEYIEYILIKANAVVCYPDLGQSELAATTASQLKESFLQILQTEITYLEALREAALNPNLPDEDFERLMKDDLPDDLETRKIQLFKNIAEIIPDVLYAFLLFCLAHLHEKIRVFFAAINLKIEESSPHLVGLLTEFSNALQYCDREISQARACFSYEALLADTSDTEEGEAERQEESYSPESEFVFPSSSDCFSTFTVESADLSRLPASFACTQQRDLFRSSKIGELLTKAQKISTEKVLPAANKLATCVEKLVLFLMRVKNPKFQLVCTRTNLHVLSGQAY